MSYHRQTDTADHFPCEEYQSWEKVSEGHVTSSYDPDQGYMGGYSNCRCGYSKCANGYAYWLGNSYCKHGHEGTGTFASGWPACPHGYCQPGTQSMSAHCFGDSGCNTPGYRAPCGRTTTKTDDIYGYVTRTRTTTYTKEAGCLSSTLYDKSDASISTRIR